MNTLAAHAWWATPQVADSSDRTSRPCANAARLQTSVRRLTRPALAAQDMPDVRPMTTRRHVSPDSLRAAWQSWQARQPGKRSHAQAACALHVPEGVLLAALAGEGIIQLRPDLGDLLAPAASWGQMMLEMAHPLGSVRLLMQPNAVRLGPQAVVLVQGMQRASLATRGVAHCYLVSGPDLATYGLHWFDFDGKVIARLTLPPGPDQQLAMAHLLQFMVTEHKRPPPQERPSELHAQVQWCAINTAIRSATALARIGQEVSAAVARLPALQVTLQGQSAALVYRGPVSMNTADALPDLAEPCQLKFDPDAMTHAFICIAPDDTPFLRLHGTQSESIGLTPDLGPADAWSWLRALTATELR